MPDPPAARELTNSDETRLPCMTPLLCFDGFVRIVLPTDRHRAVRFKDVASSERTKYASVDDPAPISKPEHL